MQFGREDRESHNSSPRVEVSIVTHWIWLFQDIFAADKLIPLGAQLRQKWPFPSVSQFMVMSFCDWCSAVTWQTTELWVFVQLKFLCIFFFFMYLAWLKSGDVPSWWRPAMSHIFNPSTYGWQICHPEFWPDSTKGPISWHVLKASCKSSDTDALGL